MKGTTHIHDMNNFGTMFVYPLTTLKQHKMKRTPNTILAALVLAFMTSLVGITQVHNWTQLATAVFGAAISLGLIGLIATEK
jgi:hypothetical protein